MSGIGAVTSPYSSTIAAASEQYGVPQALISSVIAAESSGNPYATSKTGAQGLMQLEPSTANALGVVNPYDPTQNIMGGTKYLAQLLQQFNGNVSLAVAAYNAGPGAVQQYGGIPPYPETQNYVQTVLAGAGLSSSTTLPSIADAVNGSFTVGDQIGGPGATVAGNTYAATSGTPGVTPPVGSVEASSGAQGASGGFDPTFGVAGAISNAVAGVEATATAIATSVFVGALALALISGGIIWLASGSPAARDAAKAVAA